MTAPSWPRLAAAAADPDVRRLRARWRTVSVDRERTGVVLWRRAGELVVALSEDGGLHVEDVDLTGLLPRGVGDGDDYSRAAAPTRPVVHHGRACWAVELLPLARKSGLLTVVVDDATGVCMSQAYASGDLLELTSLEPDVELSDADLSPALAVDTESDRIQALHELAQRRPPPTPRYFPARLVRLEDPGVLHVYGERDIGWVSYAPLGEPAPMNFWGGEHVHRFEARGRAWAVCTPEAVSLEAARTVIERLEDLPT